MRLNYHLVLVASLLWGSLAAASDQQNVYLPKIEALRAADVPLLPLEYAHMMPQQEPLQASQAALLDKFQGQITLSPLADKNRYDLADRPALPVDFLTPFLLPEISFQFVLTEQNEIIPTVRSLILTEHPYWDYFIGVGQIWQDPKAPAYHRIVMPLSLVEKNQNCVHNGIISFALDEQAQITHFYYQISSETCGYFKPDLWGMGELAFRPHLIPHSAQLVADYQQVKKRRLATKPVSALGQQSHRLDVANLALSKVIETSDMTAFGVVYQGTHYVSECQTRAGLYPFCETLVLPSYSTAKSVFAALTLLYLQQPFPDVFAEPVQQWVPECKGPDWQGVTFAHLLDMRSGNYDSNKSAADENAPKLLRFFEAQSHQEKIRFSCQAYSRQSQPGTQFVYHSSDTYILGTALNTFIKAKMGANLNIYDDIFLKKIVNDLSLSPVTTRSRTSMDEFQQVFSGYGLFYTRDDIAKISQFILKEAALAPGKSLLESVELTRSLQGVDAPYGRINGAEFFAYKNGFWARDFSHKLPCQHASWLPFMSGYGGITVALLPNTMTYYYFSDSYQFEWSDAAVELHKLGSLCRSD